METETLALAQEIDFSMWALFARATLTVKLVMLVLIIASFWSWAIIIQKHLAFRNAQTEARRFDAAFWSGEPLDELYQKLGPDPSGRSEAIFVAGMTEWQRSHRADGAMIPGAQSRIDRSMDWRSPRNRPSWKRVCPFWPRSGPRPLSWVFSARSGAS